MGRTRQWCPAAVREGQDKKNNKKKVLLKAYCVGLLLLFLRGQKSSLLLRVAFARFEGEIKLSVLKGTADSGS